MRNPSGILLAGLGGIVLLSIGGAFLVIRFVIGVFVGPNAFLGLSPDNARFATTAGAGIGLLGAGVVLLLGSLEVAPVRSVAAGAGTAAAGLVVLFLVCIAGMG